MFTVALFTYNRQYNLLNPPNNGGMHPRAPAHAIFGNKLLLHNRRMLVIGNVNLSSAVTRTLICIVYAVVGKTHEYCQGLSLTCFILDLHNRKIDPK